MNIDNHITGSHEYDTVAKRPVSNGVNNIEQIVMKRVRRIHLVRRFVNRTTLKAYGVACLSAVLLSTVSVANVYANMPSVFSPGNFMSFMYQAIINTETLVQATLVGIVCVVALMLRDVMRGVRESRVFWQGSGSLSQ